MPQQAQRALTGWPLFGYHRGLSLCSGKTIRQSPLQQGRNHHSEHLTYLGSHHENFFR